MSKKGSLGELGLILQLVGGTVMASLGIVVGVLHFDPAGVALLLAVFALQDSFGTACNVTGDGALALMLEGLFNRKAASVEATEQCLDTV